MSSRWGACLYAVVLLILQESGNIRINIDFKQTIIVYTHHLGLGFAPETSITWSVVHKLLLLQSLMFGLDSSILRLRLLRLAWYTVLQVG